MKEINKLTKGKVEIEAYLKKERRRRFGELRGYIPRTNYINENDSWTMLPDLPRRFKNVFMSQELKTIKDVLNISVFEVLKNRNLGHKGLDKLIDYIEEHGHKIKTHEGK
jgi:DNA-directed RNA polymerase alpha subunit